jgi:hypothetical protein
MKAIKYAIAAATLGLLVACGGGGGGGGGVVSSVPASATGVFLDSPVSGINYRTASGSGKTNANGEFSYIQGETVTFSVGNIDLPAVSGNSTVTPLNLANTTDVNNQVVSNILVFLQSLDVDGNPTNGIQISPNAHAAATTSIDFNVAHSVFRANSLVTNLIANSGSSNTAPISLASATSHFLQTLGISNVAPVANAGQAQSVLTSSKVTLNGSGSTDANNDPLSYSWALSNKPNGSNAALGDATSSTPYFTPDIAGTYVVSLVVNDGKLNSTTSTVTVTSANANVAPIANAGANQKVSTNSSVVLSGALSSDANNDPLTYAWTFTSKPANSSAVLSNSATVNPTFTADKAGDYVVSLAVNDGTVSSAPVTVTISVATANIAPVANPGAAQNVVTGSLVSLNGANSSDANGDSLTYSWTITSKPASSTASLSSTTSVNPTFTADKAGNYVVSITVSDGILSSSPSNVTITAATANIAPVANAGVAQNVVVGATTTLNGAGSSDANGDAITYLWSLVSKPVSSSASLINPTTVNPTFAPDIAGSYVLRLIVNDGSLSSEASTVTITASTSNIAPVANAGVAQSVVTGSTVTLNGSASNDSNGDSLTYSWSFVSKPAGSTASLSSSTSVNPTFTAGSAGSYVLSLVVNDGSLSSTASTVTITASTANLAPVANAGGGLNVYVGTTVTLNGTGSYDPNGDSLRYGWAFVSKPVGSSASLSGATTATPSFIADVAGSFVVALAVGDGSLTSQISTVTITSSPVPVASSVSLYLFGGVNNATYLGCVNCNQFHEESICNKFGTYGSAFSGSSIWNQFGTYGSSFQSYSPWNSFSTSGPLLLGSNGVNYGYFTTNAFRSNRTTLQALLNVLNFYSSTNNLATTRTYTCGN